MTHKYAYDKGGNGYYWSATPYGSDNAWYLVFGNSDTSTNNSFRRYGRFVRCVAE
ncbi:MAG: DUF1566 domain-containing protein [Dysgonamonadaceae bacterium]|jgi:hypothetical protein|nr:DUF1566 domain-containing protein [Dysgonamonadaceae bacterium]